MTYIHRPCFAWLRRSTGHVRTRFTAVRCADARCKGALRLSCTRSSSSSAGENTTDNSDGMKVYDSLSSSYRSLPLASPPTTAASSSPTHRLGTAWYVCGPTVYDSAHLGHGRTYVLLDILRRVALHNHDGAPSSRRPRPLYVMNITDVDDKIIQRSVERSASRNCGGDDEEEGEVDPIELARHYEREFWEDMDALNVARPDVVCRVSEHVESTIVPYIQRIVDGGMAYVVPERHSQRGPSDPQLGSVYFDVRAFESRTNGRTKYGKLAPDFASTDFFSWEGGPPPDGIGDPGEGGGATSLKKRDPRDFCLWKYRPRSSETRNVADDPIVEPSSVSYTSPWGPGRPGWHVECSAMIERLSRDFESTHEFGVHAGGVDLKFPHHSNEIAQAEAYAASATPPPDRERRSADGCREWIPHWVHTGHLYVKGRKMSKSLKNFVTIREMLGANSMDQANAWSSPADDFRLWVLGLSGSYRGPATYSRDRMDEARVTREKWVRFLMEGQECLDRWERDVDKSSRLWEEDELRLFNAAIGCNTNCQEALMDDLDGATFVKELVHMADLGLKYVEKEKENGNQSGKNRPSEPLRLVLNTFRRQLDLVGFSQRTASAGTSAGHTFSQTSLSSSNSTSIVDQAVLFRSVVRSVALNAVRKKKDSLDATKEILRYCDEMREYIFPKLGVEIMDGKSDAEATNRGWRHCSPRESTSK